MPSYEDIFFLNFLWEKQLLSNHQIKSLLHNFYREAEQGKTVNFATVAEKSNLIPKDDLSHLWNKTLETVSSLHGDSENQRLTMHIFAASCRRQKILGTSALSASYRAIHPQIGTCVLKCCQGEIAKNTKFIRSFLAQIEKSKHITHPNWGSIYAVDYDNMAIIKELIFGESLEDFLTHGKMSVEQACWVIWQASQAMETAAKSGFIHKNLKPSNLIVSYRGQIKVVDGCIPPTLPHYLSPEQCAQKKSDIRSDIYSLGVIFYRLLTGELPFKGENAQEVMNSHVNGQPVSIYELSSCPRDVGEIVNCMLARQVEQRYANFSQLNDILQQSLEKNFALKQKQTPLLDLVPYLDLSRMLDISRDDKQIQQNVPSEEKSSEICHPTDTGKEAEVQTKADSVSQDIVAEEATTKAQIKFASIPAQQGKPQKPVDVVVEETREPATKAQIKFASIPPQQGKPQKTVDIVAEETREAATKAQIKFASIPPQPGKSQKPSVQTGTDVVPQKKGCVKEQAIPIALECDRKPLSTGESLEAIAVDEESRIDEHWEDGVPGEETNAEPLSVPEEEDFAADIEESSSPRISAIKLTQPDDITISTRPIPQPRPEPTISREDTAEEWGPGLKGDVQDDTKFPTSSLKDRVNKVRPYFKQNRTENAED